MKTLDIVVSGTIATKRSKKYPEIDGRLFDKPLNRRGMDVIYTVKGVDEKEFNKEMRKFLKTCGVLPKSRAERYLQFGNNDFCYRLTLNCYKALAPYLRAEGYMI